MRNDNLIKGKLCGVGIGPGDPKLLTLKAKEALEAAEVIFAPKGNEEGISLARRIIEQVIEGRKTYIELTFPMTKDKNILQKYWKKAGRRIAGELKKGKQAVFVTLGDPFIYSTYIYLLKTLKEDFPDIDVETIPGISAFSAASARAGFPLLEGKERMAVLPVSDTLDGIEDALDTFDTVVLMKVGRNLQKVIRLLKQKGLAKNSVLISRIGHPNERIIRNIASIKDKELGYLSVILVKSQKNTKSPFKVYFIGAGPGDAQLLTIKALKIIQKADIIIYAGSLVNKDILGFAKKAAVSYDSAEMTLEEVLGIIKKEKSNKKIIARLHSGDPSIYGAIQEQMDWCEKEGIAYEVIPGVSSYQAAAASLKQEFTLPGLSQTVILTRLSGRTKVPAKEDLEKLAKIRATLVIFLSVQEIARVVRKLKCGYAQDTPVAVIERVSWPDERIIYGRLADIAKKVKDAGIKRQALIIVGEVLRKKDYRPSRLYDKDFSHGFRGV